MSSFIIHDVTVATISPVDQAQNQMSSMWKQLESLHKTIDGGSQVILNFSCIFSRDCGLFIVSSISRQQAPPTGTSLINERSLQLHCTLCREKIRYIAIFITHYTASLAGNSVGQSVLIAWCPNKAV